MAQETVADLAREFLMTEAEAVDILSGLGVEVSGGASPYGVWGALGTIDGGEAIGADALGG